MVTSVMVPTLGPTTYLRDIGSIIKYTLRQYAAMPKSATYTYGAMMISLRDTISQYGNNKRTIIQPIRTELSDTLNRIIHTGRTNVQASTEDIDDVRYSIVIEVITIIGENTYRLSEVIDIDEEGRPTVASETTL